MRTWAVRPSARARRALAGRGVSGALADFPNELGERLVQGCMTGLQRVRERLTDRGLRDKGEPDPCLGVMFFPGAARLR
ncbi:hypothetical protein ABIA38_009063 [Embleya sp. AB8]